MPIPKQENFDITEVLESTVNLYNNTHDVHVSSTIEKRVNRVEGDSQLMGSIFTNLIINAIQSVSYTKKPIIEVGLERKENTVIITFKDNGEGISPEFIDNVFLPNFSTKETGSGIGLAVAKRGIEHAHGRIWFETILGQGTIFYIEIPLLN